MRFSNHAPMFNYRTSSSLKESAAYNVFNKEIVSGALSIVSKDM